MMNEIGEIIVGWVEERNPTFIEYHERSSLGFALLNPTYIAGNKKSGPYNAYFLWLIANRWKGAPKAHYRIYPLVLKELEHKLFVCNYYRDYGD